jgi:putative transposase
MEVLDLIREGKIKRFFRARRKLNAAHLVSHITQRAAGREPLFLEDGDYLGMLGLLKQVSEDYELRVYAFCLMPNHVHLLLSPTKRNLHEAMRDLFSRYATIFNRKYERKGHLFAGPYRQAVCFDTSYILAASLYIHLNPTRADRVRNPIAYRWSSCRLYCENVSRKSFLDSDFVLNLFPEQRLKKEKYKELLQQAADFKVEDLLERKEALEDFRRGLIEKFPASAKRFGRLILGKGIPDESFPSIEELDEMIDRAKVVPSRNKAESLKARKYAIEQLIARGYRRSEIADRLGISRKTVYNILHRIN